MHLRHVALVCSSEEIADKFYQNLLGLKKSEPKTLPHSLANAIFEVDAEPVIINYRSEDLHFEIFITGANRPREGRIEHVCLEIDDLEKFSAKCREMNVEIAHIPKGDSTLTFVKDDDGNIFEITNPCIFI